MMKLLLILGVVLIHYRYHIYDLTMLGNVEYFRLFFNQVYLQLIGNRVCNVFPISVPQQPLLRHIVIKNI